MPPTDKSVPKGTAVVDELNKDVSGLEIIKCISISAGKIASHKIFDSNTHVILLIYVICALNLVLLNFLVIHYTFNIFFLMCRQWKQRIDVRLFNSPLNKQDWHRYYQLY